MKTLLCSAFLLVIIANNVLDIHAISSLDDETYSTFLELLKGEFNVPLQQSSTKQKSAIVRFWRNRGHLSLHRGNVCFDGKPVLRKSTVSKVVAKALKETKGSGVRKLYHQLKDVCSGVGERDVRCVLGKSRLHQRLNVRFQNKAILKPIRARTVQSRHQVDLVSMESTPVKRRGRALKYVLSLLDVFSRYHWLVPLEGKRSSSIAKAMTLQFTKSMVLPVSFNMIRDGNSTVLLKNCAVNSVLKLFKGVHTTHNHREKSNGPTDRLRRR